MSYVSENRDWLEPYVRQLADAMGLRDWKVTLHDEPADDGSAGQSETIYGRKILHIRLGDGETSTIEDVRETIVHELLHAHMEPFRWASNNLEPVLGQAAFAVWDGALVDTMEVAIETIAVAWAQALPLPTGGAG